jgi:hypothetical protein
MKEEAMRRLLTLASCILVLGLAGAAPLAAKEPAGGCPPGADWELVKVSSLHIPREVVSGLASLDGNGDGWTCISPLEQRGGLVFRDNTVQA